MSIAWTSGIGRLATLAHSGMHRSVSSCVAGPRLTAPFVISCAGLSITLHEQDCLPKSGLFKIDKLLTASVIGSVHVRSAAWQPAARQPGSPAARQPGSVHVRSAAWQRTRPIGSLAAYTSDRQPGSLAAYTSDRQPGSVHVRILQFKPSMWRSTALHSLHSADRP